LTLNACLQDLVGVVEHHQSEGKEAVGAGIQGRVLDVSKEQGIVDLSLLPRLTKLSKKKAKLKVGSEVEVVVELAKQNYCVVSVPSAHNAIGFLSHHDFNAASDEAANTKAAAGGFLVGG
jgi:ribosomal protein S1